MALSPTPGKQIAAIMHQLQMTPLKLATEERFSEICAAVVNIPPKSRPGSLIAAIARTFGKSTGQVNAYLRIQVKQEDFDLLVPPDGWIHEYIEWTRQTEPPTVFHFFVAAVAIGATLGRNVFYNKGAYKVFPNLCVMLLAPSGRCRKTSAANLGSGLYVKGGGKVLADKTTPEALIDSMLTSPTALIYAPELSVFLGKQKYNEGMVPLLTALFDCPDEWTTKTVGRGEMTVANIALSALMCSTVDWLQTSVPPDVFGGGFMSRFLFIAQDTTPRSFPRPPALDAEVKKHLIAQLGKLRTLKSEVFMDPEAGRWYDDWYSSRPGAGLASDKQFAGYHERKPDHLIRLAMIVKASRLKKFVEAEGAKAAWESLTLTKRDLQQALKVFGWLEEWLPTAFDQLSASQVGEDQTRIVRQLRQAGGSMEHSTLLRKNSGRLNTEQFKRAITTLKEAKLIEWDAVTRTYFLSMEGWGG